MKHAVRRLGMESAVRAEEAIRRFKGSSRSGDSLAAFLGGAGNYLLVAEAGDEVAGFLMAYRLERADRDASQMFIYEVSVGERWRRRGIAGELVRAITTMARQEGMVETFVLTSRGNRAARALYARTGGVVEDDAAMLFVYPHGSECAA